MVLVSVKPLTELRGDSGDESDLSTCSELPCSSGFNGAKSHDYFACELTTAAFNGNISSV